MAGHEAASLNFDSSHPGWVLPVIRETLLDRGVRLLLKWNCSLFKKSKSTLGQSAGSNF